ncbi:MAG: 3-oxoacyl-acyl-carrier-protein synthase II [Halothiobacillaceae bacterium]|nr:MAG: 3-oxoacyl-acyl-carrier-protein synthase II [Halothiobacillaceae bacterium]
MSPRRVAITGMGVTNPFGGDLDQFFSHLLNGDSAITLLTIDDPAGALKLPTLQCHNFDPVEVLGRALAHTMDRFSQLGAAAAFAAWSDAGFALDGNVGRSDYGLAWGTGVGGVSTFERGYQNLYRSNQKLFSPLAVLLAMNNSAAAQIAIKLGLAGSCLTYSVACASSTVAIGEAFHAVRNGRATLMVAGGSEAPLAYGVLRAWEALRILAPPGDSNTVHTACRPFSKHRTGLVLGEGAGALVLEEWEHATARGAHIYAELAGYGTTCDHSHLVRPNPIGEIAAIQQALASANLSIDEIDYVNAHATATAEGDIAEISAIKTVFGEQAAALPMSSTKSMHGHLLGATGAFEAIITVMALHKSAIPPTAHLEEIDPACAGVRHVIGAPLTGKPLRAALSNSFAFGGVNAVLAFRSASNF